MTTQTRRALRALLTDFALDRRPGCPERSPIWRSTAVLLPAALAYGIYVSRTGRTMPAPTLGHIEPDTARWIVNLLLAVLLYLVVHVLLDYLFGRKHLHCDECDRCGLEMGVPARRTWFAARRAHRALGWRAPFVGRDLCPHHGWW